MPPPPRSWLGKFADAFRGLYHAVSTQSSFAAHLPVAALAVAAGAWFGLATEHGLSSGEWCLVVMAIGGVLAAEVFNTSLEDLARAVGRYPDPGIRDALDAASAGVLVAVGTAILVGIVIFGPRVAVLLGFCD